MGALDITPAANFATNRQHWIWLTIWAGGEYATCIHLAQRALYRALDDAAKAGQIADTDAERNAWYLVRCFEHYRRQFRLPPVRIGT